MKYIYLFAVFGLLGIVAHAAPVKSEAATPIVDAASGQLYGATFGSEWLSATDAATLVTRDLAFRVYASGGDLLQETTLSSTQTSEICSNPTYQANDSLPKGAMTLVSGPWDAAPRKPKELDPSSPIYRDALTLWLQEQNIDDKKPTLSQIWRVDLEGDGRDEVLIAATRHRGSATSTQAGDYSVLLLRKLVDDEVVTIALESEIYLETCIAECALERHEAINLLDLNGDGNLEIIVKSSGYESTTQAIYSIEGSILTKRLEWTCGV